MRELRCTNCNAKNWVNEQDHIAMCEYCDQIIVVNKIEYKEDLDRKGKQIMKEHEEITSQYRNKKKKKSELINKIQQNIWNKEVGILYVYGLGILLIPFLGMGILILLYIPKLEEMVVENIKKADATICEIDKEIVCINRRAVRKKDEINVVDKKLQEFYAVTEG